MFSGDTGATGADPTPNSNSGLYAGLGGAGASVLLLLGVGFFCCRRRKRLKVNPGAQTANQPFTNLGNPAGQTQRSNDQAVEVSVSVPTRAGTPDPAYEGKSSLPNLSRYTAE